MYVFDAIFTCTHTGYFYLLIRPTSSTSYIHYYSQFHTRRPTYDDINRTPGYQIKIHHFVQLFISFFSAVFGFKQFAISL